MPLRLPRRIMAAMARGSRFLSLLPWAVSEAWNLSDYGLLGTRLGRRKVTRRMAARLLKDLPTVKSVRAVHASPKSKERR